MSSKVWRPSRTLHKAHIYSLQEGDYLDKHIAEKVIERSNMLCEVCGGNYMVQLHHIVGGRGRRKVHETEESVIALCWHCHHGDYGIHGKDGKKLNLKLKRDLQNRYFNKGYSEEEVRRLLGGKLY